MFPPITPPLGSLSLFAISSLMFMKIANQFDGLFILGELKAQKCFQQHVKSEEKRSRILHAPLLLNPSLPAASLHPIMPPSPPHFIHLCAISPSFCLSWLLHSFTLIGGRLEKGVRCISCTQPAEELAGLEKDREEMGQGILGCGSGWTGSGGGSDPLTWTEDTNLAWRS